MIDKTWLKDRIKVDGEDIKKFYSENEWIDGYAEDGNENPIHIRPAFRV